MRREVAFFKDCANAVFFELAMPKDVTEFATKLAMFIGGAIDFIESNGKRSDPINGLAAEGMRFTDGHSSSGICTPNRFALPTGQHH